MRPYPTLACAVGTDTSPSWCCGTCEPRTVPGTNPQEVDVRYETICVLDWLPSPVMSLLYSRKLAVCVGCTSAACRCTDMVLVSM